jgi:hypothetical protein
VALQVGTTSLHGRDAMAQALRFYEDVLAAADRSRLRWSADPRVLDFGVGWGRVARLFLRDVPMDRVFGIDVDPAFAKLTCELFGNENFTRCDPLPPTTFRPGTFLVVSAYSVFSHLSPVAADAWIGEFARVVRRGGLVAFTTRDVTFLDYCGRFAGGGATQYETALGRLFPDFDAARAAYARGEFVFATSSGVSGGGPRDESFYGEAFIPPAYVAARYSGDFELVDCRFDPSRYDQRLFVLRRR